MPELHNLRPAFAVPAIGGAEGYEALERVLALAYDRSARGKGKERHALDNLPFWQQPIMSFCRIVGVGGQTYQIMKKAHEATELHNAGNYGAAQKELLDIIVYAAAAYLLSEEKAGPQE